MRSCDNFLFCPHLLVKEGDALFTYVVIFRAALSLVCMLSASASGSEVLFCCVYVSILKEFFMLLLSGGFGPFETDVD